MYTFYFDSGTSNSRGYLLEGRRIAASHKIALGSKDVSQSGDRTLLPRGLKALYDTVLTQAGVPDGQVGRIYASGMITSPFGLTEVPHTLTPFDAKTLAAAIHPYYEPLFFKRTLYLIPGAKTAGGALTLADIPRVCNVRGEEIEAIGVKDHVPAAWRDGRYIILFPGSHTHALLFSGDQVADLFSNFSGEIFHALTTATILAGSTRADASEEKSYDAGAANTSGPDSAPDGTAFGLAALRDYGFSRAVYIVHATKIFEAAGDRTRRDMLSAIVTGTVFQSLAIHLAGPWQDVKRMAIYGDARSIRTGLQAAAVFLPQMEVCGIPNDQAGRVCSVEGLWHIMEEEALL